LKRIILLISRSISPAVVSVFLYVQLNPVVTTSFYATSRLQRQAFCGTN